MAELEPLTFEWAGKEWKARRVNLSDYSAIKEAIRRERLSLVAPGAACEVLALVISQPISNEELFGFLVGLQGQYLLLYRCVHAMNESFTPENAERMVFDGDPFVKRLLEESKIINPTKPTP